MALEVVKQSFFKKENIGDKVSGHYLGKSVQADKLKEKSGKPGAMQTWYKIMTADGGVTILTGSIGPNGIHPQMELVKPGTFVQAEYTENRKSNTPGFADMKIVTVSQDRENVRLDLLNNLEPVVSKEGQGSGLPF